MPDASVNTNDSQSTSITVEGQMTLLQTSSGGGIDPFNQGHFADTASELPIQTSSGGKRTIRASGCGLCALTSYLAAAGCLAPSYDANQQAFSIADGAARIDPRSFNQYLLHYARANSSSDADRGALIRSIYAPDGGGALRNGSDDLRVAINLLVSLSQSCDVSTVNFRSEGGTGGANVGSDLPDVTSHLDGGDPVIIAVCFDGHTTPAHQILAVGYVRFDADTFYVVVDSGFGPMNPYPKLAMIQAPLTRGVVLHYCASKARAKKYGRVASYRKLSGLQGYTNLAATTTPPPSAQRGA